MVAQATEQLYIDTQLSIINLTNTINYIYINATSAYIEAVDIAITYIILYRVSKVEVAELQKKDLISQMSKCDIE